MSGQFIFAPERVPRGDIVDVTSVGIAKTEWRAEMGFSSNLVGGYTHEGSELRVPERKRGKRGGVHHKRTVKS